MACGCESACGCNVTGDHETAEVARVGDTFIVSAILPIRAIEDTDCVDLSIDPETKTLRAAPIVADAADQDASVQLRCSQDGLAGDVVIDPASTAPISLTPDGLRIDLPAPLPSLEDASPGTLRLTASLVEEAGWLDADGGEVSRLTFPNLHDFVSLVTSQGVRTNGSPVVSNVRTKYLAAGMPAEIDGFPPGLTIVSIDNDFTMTVSAPATSDGADTPVRVYPYGDGDGADTFNLPLIDEDEFVKQMAPGEGLGAFGGTNVTSLEIANLPPHEHAGTTATDSGHGHPGSASSTASSTATSTGTTTLNIADDGAHFHVAGQGASPAADFVTVESPVTSADFIWVRGGTGPPGDSPNDVQIPTFLTDVDPGAGTSIRPVQGNRAATSFEGEHDHSGSTASTSVATSVATDVDTTVTVDAGTANITVDVALEGSGTDLDNRPKFRAFRWVVKT